MSLTGPENAQRLTEAVGAQWGAQARAWASMRQVALYGEVQRLLTRGVCAWAAVPLPEDEIDRRTREISALFDYAGTVGPKHWRSQVARRRSEHWLGRIVRRIRDGRLQPPGSAAHAVAWHRELSGELLRPRVAAVELLNLIRPTVAVAVYITFVAHALQQHAECRRMVQSGEDGYLELFVQEVRRFYPFFPSVIARSRGDFEWNGYRFPAGRRVVLDLYGTNHDPRTWHAPEQFQPERFRNWNGSAFNFIPQGGGDRLLNHRCPGEWFAIELMKQAADLLARRLAYDVPPQDLTIDYSRLPALPRSRFVMTNVRVNVG